MNITVDNSEHMLEQKYRPSNIDECILPEKDKKAFKAIIESGRIPSMLLVSKSAGTGKTTVAKAMCKELGMKEGIDYLFVNGAECKIDFVKDVFPKFASTANGLDSKVNGKVIIVDEFDRKDLVESQRWLRSFMEAYSNNCTFIFTANDINGIISPLRDSRMETIYFGEPKDLEEKKSLVMQMYQRMKQICELEGIKVESDKALAVLVGKNYPDMRRITKLVGQHARRNGNSINESILDEIIYDGTTAIAETIEAIKNKKLGELQRIGQSHSHEFAQFVEKLHDEMKNVIVEPIDKLGMIEIIGEFNKTYGLASNPSIHLYMMLVKMAMAQYTFK